MSLTNGYATSDALDAVDYDPIDHLNALFSHPSHLSTLPSVCAALQRNQDDLDAEIASVVTAHATSEPDSVRRIQDAKAELAEMFAKIEGVRERALETERTITEMTADIKRLDSTKRNLTLSMTALKRLQMLTTAYEQLRGLSQTRQYRECAHLLQAVIQLMAHFKSYRSIDQIAVLSKNVAEVQRELLEQVCEDFEVGFAKGEIQQKRTVLAESCLVMDALGDHARTRLITWYCNTQLREYRQVFRGSDEAGSLDNISRRYSWFTRMLKTYDAEHAALFPVPWKVNEMLANAFCETTREDYKSILQKSMRRTDGQTPDVNLLLSCLQETLDFEHGLERRFAAGESRSSLDTVLSGDDSRRQGFSQAISEAFEPYLSLWVESQDRQLAQLMPKYRQQPVRQPEDEIHAQLVLPSSTELFHSYRVTLAQCAKLSTGARLLELCKTFAKYLDAYAQQVLIHLLSLKTGGPSIEDAVVILNTADYCYQTTNQLEEKIRSRIDEDLRGKIDLQSQADTFMGVASAAIRALVRRAEIDCEPAWREMRTVAWGKMDMVGDQSPFIAPLLQRISDRSRDILRFLHKSQYSRAYCDNLVDALTNTYIINIVACRPISETGAEQMLLDSYVLKKGLAQLPTLQPEQSSAAASTAFNKRINVATAKLDTLLKTLQVRASPPEGLVQAYLIHIRDRSEQNFRKVLDLKGIVARREQTHLIELFNAHKLSSANENLQLTNPTLGALHLGTQPISSSLSSGSGVIGNAATAASIPSVAISSQPSLLSSATASSAATASSVAAAAGLAVNTGFAHVKDSTAAASAAASAAAPSTSHPSNLGSAIYNAARDAGDRFALTAHAATPASSTETPLSSANPSTLASRTASPPILSGSRFSHSTTTSPVNALNGGGGMGNLIESASSTASTPQTASLNENLRNLGKFFKRDGQGFAGFGRS